MLDNIGIFFFITLLNVAIIAYFLISDDEEKK